MEINEMLAMFFGFCLFAIAVKFWYDARKLEDENEELRKKNEVLVHSLGELHEKYFMASIDVWEEDEQS